jgi:hypothetical protein
MQKIYSPCERCLEFLERHYPSLCRRWIGDCRISTHNRFYRFPNDSFFSDSLAEIQTMEELGFYTTHETDIRWLVVRVEGIDESRGCVCAGRHR